MLELFIKNNVVNKKVCVIPESTVISKVKELCRLLEDIHNSLIYLKTDTSVYLYDYKTNQLEIIKFN